MEIIVVDDGSTDGTVDVYLKYGNGISYFYQENQGESAARNLGVNNARGELIAFPDAEDIWLPNGLWSRQD